ncbi:MULTISPECIES: LysR substrate-binding domain-containing protein [unclassified Janthinobacterium]|uniref:LysR substrate-binding domain-containing protein n=1 Tax=unclassified Janthinobacterium TaxID=2610881 RepID=UPI00288C3F73|nr:LysR substrate-binding domain-containing protein [Janthinobacterium sp. S3M3]
MGCLYQSELNPEQTPGTRERLAGWHCPINRGLTWLPHFHVRAALADGSLREVLAPYAVYGHPAHSCWLLWPSGPHLAPKVRALIDFFAEAGILLRDTEN